MVLPAPRPVTTRLHWYTTRVRKDLRIGVVVVVVGFLVVLVIMLVTVLAMLFQISLRIYAGILSQHIYGDKTGTLKYNCI